MALILSAGGATAEMVNFKTGMINFNQGEPSKITEPPWVKDLFGRKQYWDGEKWKLPTGSLRHRPTPDFASDLESEINEWLNS